MSVWDDGSFRSVVAGVGVAVALRILDYILPTDHHFPHLPWVDEENKEEEDNET